MSEPQRIDLKYAVQALWRRRYLLCVPLLVMLPLVALIGLIAPRVYVAKSLILLQEEGRDNPLRRNDNEQGSRMQDRAAGFEALLKSDLVISKAMKEILGDATPTTPLDVAEWKDDFNKSITLELIGTDFVALSLKGENPKGLGRRAKALTTAFLEVLLADESTVSASQIMLEKRKADLATAERNYAEYLAHLPGHQPQAAPTVVGAIPNASREDPNQIKASETAEAERTGELLERAVEAAKIRYADYAARFSTMPNQTLGVLSVPERVKIIEMPTDPEIPVSSGFKFVIAGLVGALGLSICLVVIAELTDQTVRSADEFEAVVGAPVLTRLS